MFISIQNSSGTFADGYEPMPLRTGYESVMANRVDDLFAQTAKMKGKVTKVTEVSITIEYEDGSTVSLQLGRRYGTVASLVLPHQLETLLKEGDTVEPGDLLIYNTRYFTPDPLNTKVAAWKQGVLIKTAIAETTDTLEDSSALSERAAKLLGTQATTIRNITVNFKQSIHRLVRVGDEVDVDSILCTIEDLTTGDSSLFDDPSLDTLRLLAANTPRAKTKGRVERVEVFYNGDLDEMSDSLQELAMASDRNRKRLARDLQRNYTSGKVDESMRVEGNPLLLDNAVIRVYITEQIAAGVGDKGVFGNQMKTIFGRIMSGTNETASGVPIDAIFGYLSISNRIVRSPELMGTTNTLLKVVSKRVAAVYFEK